MSAASATRRPNDDMLPAVRAVRAVTNPPKLNEVQGVAPVSTSAFQAPEAVKLVRNSGGSHRTGTRTMVLLIVITVIAAMIVALHSSPGVVRQLSGTFFSLHHTTSEHSATTRSDHMPGQQAWQEASSAACAHLLSSKLVRENSTMPGRARYDACLRTHTAAAFHSDESRLWQWARLYGIDIPSSALYNASVPPCVHVPHHSPNMSKLRIALVALSTDTPLTLWHSMMHWAESGLLELVDDKVMWINAALPFEVDAAASFGFRVIHVNQSTIGPLVARRVKDRPPRPGSLPSSRPTSEWPFVNLFPGDRPAVRVGMAQWFVLHETDADVVLWLEKDFMPAPHLQFVELLRSLLLAVAHVHSGAAVVRLRRYDDPDRDGFFDCSGDGKEYCDYTRPCSMDSHLAWQIAYSHANNVSTVSNGAMRECMNEVAGLKQSTFSFPTTGTIDYSRYQHPSLDMQAWLANRTGHGPATATRTHASTDLSPLAGAAAARFHDDPALQRVVPEPLRMQCTSFRYSHWTENAAVFRRQWWLERFGPIAAWTDDRMFEHYTIGSTPDCVAFNESRGITEPVCMQLPGLFWHVEVDGRR